MKRFILFFAAFVLIFYGLRDKSDGEGLLRLHVVANSDSPSDIELKMEVVKALEDYIKGEKLDGGTLVEVFSQKQGEINALCDSTLTENGAEYLSEVWVGKKNFEQKTLSGTSFGEGEYDALIVVLGKGEGRNWWSVLFPDVSLEASLALGEESKWSKTALIKGDNIVRLRCFIYDIIVSVFE